MTQKILVIIGSARKMRISPIVAHLVTTVAKQVTSDIKLEIVDLKNWNIPFDAEEGIPRISIYKNEQVFSWSNKVKSADGFIIVSPEYNRGYSGVLKHAFDVLYNEFTGKPTSIVTFGSNGGPSCNEQLQKVIGEGFGMPITKTSPKITMSRESVMSREIDPDVFIKDKTNLLKESFEQLQVLLKKDTEIS